jgi:outer membrane protein TolC
MDGTRRWRAARVVFLALLPGLAGCGLLGGGMSGDAEQANSTAALQAGPWEATASSPPPRLGPGALRQAALGVSPSSPQQQAMAVADAGSPPQAAPASESPPNDEKSVGKATDLTPLPASASPETPATPIIPSPPAILPIDLPGVLGMAGAENPTIAIAQAAVRLAEAERMQARLLLVPDANAGISYDHHHGNTQNSFGLVREVNDRESFDVGAGMWGVAAGTLAIPGVELFRALTDAIYAPKVAQQVVVTRRFEASATNNDILLDVGVRYYDLVGAEGRLAAIRQSEREFLEVARITGDQFETGQGNKADADRARAEVLELHQTEQAAEEEVAVASARLSELLNLDPSTRLETREGPVQMLELVDPHAPLEALIQTALEYRPEMGARAAAIAASQARYRQECARPLLPTLFVGYSAGGFGGGSQLAPVTSAPFNSRVDFDVMAFWTLQNLGLGNLALTRQRRAEVREAEADQLITVNQIRDEVAAAVADSAARSRDVGLAQRKLKRALEGYRLDLNRVRGLVGRPIEVLNSARLLASGRQEFVLALTRFNQAQLRLFVALGQPPNVAPPIAQRASLGEAEHGGRE